MIWQTADLCDAHRTLMQVAEPVFHSYGGLSRIEAPLVTVKLDQDNRPLRALLNQPGEGRAIAVDVGGDYCAVLGDIMAGLAVKNGWKALLINGYIRDCTQIKTMPLGVWARGTCPMKSAKVTEGMTQVSLTFCGLTITPGDFLYADEDGVLITPGYLEKPSRAARVQGGRSAATETYQIDRRGSEHRPTQQSGRVVGFSRCPPECLT